MLEKEGVSRIKVVGEQAKITGSITKSATKRDTTQTMSDLYMNRFAKTKNISAVAWNKCDNNYNNSKMLKSTLNEHYDKIDQKRETVDLYENIFEPQTDTISRNLQSPISTNYIRQDIVSV